MSETVKRPAGHHPFFGSGLLFIASQVLSLYFAFLVKGLLERSGTTPPETSLGLPLLYFFGAVAAVGLILLVLPLAA